jgi:hypothetical protein
MAKLPASVKVFIIEWVACFDSTSTVAAAVKEAFGLSVPVQTIEAHDPTKSSSKTQGKRWRGLFHAKRAEFLAGIDRIGITHKVKVTRMQRLERHHNKMEAAGNVPASLLEQAAKEMGDVFTNRRATEVSGAGGGPIEATHFFNLKNLTDEELAALHRELSTPETA